MKYTINIILILIKILVLFYIYEINLIDKFSNYWSDLSINNIIPITYANITPFH